MGDFLNDTGVGCLFNKTSNLFKDTSVWDLFNDKVTGSQFKYTRLGNYVMTPV